MSFTSYPESSPHYALIIQPLLHNLANIFYKVIISEGLGVYQLHPDLKRTLIALSERTGLSISQVTDEVLYTG
jgi:hypothetical protein